MIQTRNKHMIEMKVYTFVDVKNSTVTIVAGNKEAAYSKLEEQGKKRQDWKLINN